jgi:hypothetical protein
VTGARGELDQVSTDGRARASDLPPCRSITKKSPFRRSPST